MKKWWSFLLLCNRKAISGDRELFTEQAKVGSLNQIMDHYSGKSWVMPSQNLDKVRVWAVDIESMRGKNSAVN